MPTWTLFSNHGHVLLFLSQQPGARLRDVADQIGITERAVQKIVRDLQDDGVLTVTKRGRRNRYRINSRKTLRHPLDVHRTIGQLIALMRDKRKAAEPDPEASDPAEDGPPAKPRQPTGKKPSGKPAAPARQPEPEAKREEAESKTPEPKPKKPEPKKPKPEPKKPQPKKPEPKKPEPKKPEPKKRRKKPDPDDQQGSLF